MWNVRYSSSQSFHFIAILNPFIWLKTKTHQFLANSYSTLTIVSITYLLPCYSLMQKKRANFPTPPALPLPLIPSAISACTHNSYLYRVSVSRIMDTATMYSMCVFFYGHLLRGFIVLFLNLLLLLFIGADWFSRSPGLHPLTTGLLNHLFYISAHC